MNRIGSYLTAAFSVISVGECKGYSVPVEQVSVWNNLLRDQPSMFASQPMTDIQKEIAEYNTNLKDA